MDGDRFHSVHVYWLSLELRLHQSVDQLTSANRRQRNEKTKAKTRPNFPTECCMPQRITHPSAIQHNQGPHSMERGLLSQDPAQRRSE